MYTMNAFCWLLLVSLACPALAAQTELVGDATPWRAFLVLGPKLSRDGDAIVLEAGPRAPQVRINAATVDLEQKGFSRLPSAAWMKPECDLSAWSRYLQSDLADFLGHYGGPEKGSKFRIDALSSELIQGRSAQTRGDRNRNLDPFLVSFSGPQIFYAFPISFS